MSKILRRDRMRPLMKVQDKMIIKDKRMFQRVGKTRREGWKLTKTGGRAQEWDWIAWM